MSTIALPLHRSTIPRRTRIAAAFALPLGFFNALGGLIFWEWSWATPVAAWAVVMGFATVAAGTLTLCGDERGPRLLVYALRAELAFCALKLAVWQEAAALPFLAVSLAIYASVAGRRASA